MGGEKNLMIGLDLGGTSMMAIALSHQGRMIAARRRSTRPSLGPDGVTERVAKTIQRLLKDLGKTARFVLGIGIGAPGVVDHRKGIVTYAPNLGWRDYPLAKNLQSYLDLPVIIDNDVNGGAVGEYVLGAGRGSRNLVALFIGTGIGGGIILKKKLYHGSYGRAGELGHIKILPDGPICGCGQRGCAEGLASRTAMERDIRQAIASGRPSIIPSIMEQSGRDRMTSSVIQEALHKKDVLMQEIVQQAQKNLGLLVASIVNFIDPDCVVIGGGVTDRLGDSFLQPIREIATQHFLRQSRLEQIAIVPAQLAGHAGGIGSAILAWQRLEKVQIGKPGRR